MASSFVDKSYAANDKNVEKGEAKLRRLGYFSFVAVVDAQV